APASSGSGILSFQVVGRSLKLFLDGQLLAYTYDSSLSRGTTGVWGSPGATVTDFAGGPMTAASATLPFNDSFAFPSGSQLDAFWSESRGNFRVQGNQLQAHATALNLALTNQATTARIAVPADIALSSSGSQQAGLAAPSSSGVATGTTSSSNSQAGDVLVSADIALAAGQAAGLVARYEGPLNQNYYFGQLAPATSGFQAT